MGRKGKGAKTTQGHSDGKKNERKIRGIYCADRSSLFFEHRSRIVHNRKSVGQPGLHAQTNRTWQAPSQTDPGIVFAEPSCDKYGVKRDEKCPH